MKFSERIGRSSPPSVLQIDSMDSALRNSLWNLLCSWLKARKKRRGNRWDWVYPWKSAASTIAEGFTKTPIDEVPTGPVESQKWVKTRFQALDWYEVYDLIEFLAKVAPSRTLFPSRNSIEDDVNSVLEREGAGYRFVQGELTPITSEGELAAVSDAIEQADTHGLRPVSKHIRSSLRLLRRKPEADYPNATKEAISAVESTVKLITGNRAGGLKDALDELGQRVPIHGAFRDGFLKLYGYTSDGDGIRHALLEESDLGFDEAKFMVVTCSAACHLLISKAEKAGLLAGPAPN